MAKNTPPKGKGRPKGSQNKVSKAVKDALRAALEESDEDGAKGWFIRLARTEPKAFAALVGKLIPNEVVAEISGEVKLKVVDLSDGE